MGQWDLLEEGVAVAAGFEAEGLELGGRKEGGNVLVSGGGAATMEFIVGEECHVCADFMFEAALIRDWSGWLGVESRSGLALG